MYTLPLNHKDDHRTNKGRGTGDKEDREEKEGAGLMSETKSNEQENPPQLNYIIIWDSDVRAWKGIARLRRTNL
jgi:hypothetical protein